MKQWFRVVPTVALLLGISAGWDTVGAQGFNAVFTKNGTDVWAVGAAGVTYRSFTGGSSWTNQTLGAVALRDVVARGNTVWIVSDGGVIRRSLDSGGTWGLTTLPGTPDLRAIAMPTDLEGFAVGAAGTIVATTDGGTNWVPQISGTSERLNALRFRDALNGYAVGTAGTILKTTDGGAVWTPLTSGTTKELRSVDYIGSTVWVVGVDGMALMSTDDGASFAILNLRITNRADIVTVWLEDASTVYLAGGGGFIRRSTNGGATWTFLVNPMMADLSDFFIFGGTKQWACSSRNLSVIRSTDTGGNWSLPTGGTRTLSWALKQSLVGGSVRGSTVAQHGTNKNSFYCVLGNRVYKSLNKGDTWTQIGTITTVGDSNPSKTNAFYVSPTDSLLMVAATGALDRVVRSTDGGVTWTVTKYGDFTEYGVPLEMDVNSPNVLYFAPEDQKLYKSTDFGATWVLHSNQPSFRSPCDIQVVADSANIIWVGDGITGFGNGQMFRSTDGGLTFSSKYTVSGSEIPMISNSVIDPRAGLATAWGSGGVRVTKDFGATWTQGPTTSSAWGTDFSKDDANVAVYGVYSGGQSYITLDQGLSYFTAALGGSNYSYYIGDRGTFLGEQSGGMYKLGVTYNYTPNNIQSLVLAAPNGGEVWDAGSVHAVNWSGQNVALAVIEYRPNNLAAWQTVATVDGYLSSYNWTVPYEATTTAEVRVRDAWDSTPLDGSNAVFTIALPLLATAPDDTLDYGAHAKGSSTLGILNVSNPGTAPATINLATGTPAFLLNRSSLLLGPGVADTVGIRFLPTAAQPYADQVTLTGNAYNAPATVELTGAGLDTLLLALGSPDGGQSWQYNTLHDIAWESALINNVDIAYRTSEAGSWVDIATNVPAGTSPYVWTVPNTPTAEARIRVKDTGNAIEDISTNVFSIIVPEYTSSPADTLDLGLIEVETSTCDTLDICNKGTAPLTITTITSDNPVFSVGRTTLTIPAGECDTLKIFYHPNVVGFDTGTLTLTGDDPNSPHLLVVRGQAAAQGAVAPDMPRVFMLSQNHPNPFFGATQIRYALPERSHVSLEVYNLQGQKIATLVNEDQDPGQYGVAFGSGAATANGQKVGELASGIYFYRFQAGAFTRTYKMIVTR